MINKSILEIKKLVQDLHCMGTYGMVELELTKIENYVKELEGKVKNLTIPVVVNCATCARPKWKDAPHCVKCNKEYSNHKPK